MRAFCTLFDKNYLYQGVALYNSLKRHAADFKLYTLCMDSISYNMMMQIKSTDLVPLFVDELITHEVSLVRERTTHGQFCWVCQPLLCEYILNVFKHDMITYLEADSLFFSDPEILFIELGDNSISLVSHNFSPSFENAATAGKFCVQFNAFRNDNNGRQVLQQWKSNCYEYSKEKLLNYPGQTCLDYWPEQFDGVKIIDNIGAGVAPWNIQHVKFEILDSAPCVDGVPIIFYHFHQYSRCSNGSHNLGDYPLTKQIIDGVYSTYIREIQEAKIFVQLHDSAFEYQRTCNNNITLSGILRSGRLQDLYEYIKVVKRKIRGTYNVIPDGYFQ